MPSYTTFDEFITEMGVGDDISTPSTTTNGHDGITAYDLQRKNFPPIRWIVEGLLPSGFAVLAGKPKAGRKSWTALNMSLAIAYHGRALGGLATESGDVLYLDLESNQRRMKNRIGKALGERGEWPRNLHIFSHWPCGQEGIEQLELWMVRYPETKLVVVDILVNMRPKRGQSGDTYQDDSMFIQAFSQFSGRHNIAVLALHHTRKTKDTSDVFQDIYGGVGIQGGVDSMLVIENSTAGATLHVRGRDIEDDSPRPIKWDGTTYSWVLQSQHEVVGDTRKLVLDLLMDAGEDLTTANICELFPHINVSTIQSTLQRMVKDGQVERAGRGRYRINEELFKHHAPNMQ